MVMKDLEDTWPCRPFCEPYLSYLSLSSQLLQSGRTVIAAVRSSDKAKETFGANGLKEGIQEVSVDLHLDARKPWWRNEHIENLPKE
jgi:hypothetical protein